MAPTRKNHPTDKSKDKTPEDQLNRNTQSSDEVNRNEERIKAASKNQGKTPLSKSPEMDAEQRDDHARQTTGSNVPGSEIADRKNQNQQWEQGQTSQDQYPTNSKSSPASEIHHPGQHHVGLKRNRPNQMYTGNSERSGQQYSAASNTPQESEQPIKQTRKNQVGKSDGSGLSAKEKGQQMRSENATGSRNQMETDQTSGKQNTSAKKSGRRDGDK